MSAVKDLTGQRFGRLVVLERAGSSAKQEARWLCLCDCGRKTLVTGSNLRSGHTNSCGCLSAEKSKTRRTTHGLCQCRLYRVWEHMKHRCLNPNDDYYYRYGGRGITICDAWRHDFQAFYGWAMANGYDENAPKYQCTIDRIDNDKGYSPDNCRWTDMATQNRNKSNNRKVVNQ